MQCPAPMVGADAIRIFSRDTAWTRSGAKSNVSLLKTHRNLFELFRLVDLVPTKWQHRLGRQLISRPRNDPEGENLENDKTKDRTRRNPEGTIFGHNPFGRKGKPTCEQCRKRKSKVNSLIYVSN
jgi:hypothetical protein